MLRNKNTIQLGWQTESLAHNSDDVLARSTIVVPTLDAGARISALLDRLTTNFPHTRVLVVDAGSTDGTQAIVLEYVRRPGSLVDLLQQQHTPDQGLNASMLQAMQRCGTPFMMVVGVHTERPRTLVQQFAESLEDGAEIVLPAAEEVFPKPLGSALAQGLVTLRLRHCQARLRNPLAMNFAIDVLKLRAAMQRGDVLIDPRSDFFVFDLVKSRRADFCVVETLERELAEQGTKIDLRTAAALFFS
ncbi:MAG: glycosyltransferase [Oligoflexia bacterium]|nr:glycosyltransferase [Oligoflexia bacterium]